MYGSKDLRKDILKKDWENRVYLLMDFAVIEGAKLLNLYLKRIKYLWHWANF